MATMTARPMVPGPGNALPAEDDDSWIREFRQDIQMRAMQRRQELSRQAEEEFQKAIESSPRDDVTRERLRQRFEFTMREIQKVLEDEENQLIEKEKGFRHWSRLGHLSPEMSEAMMREQQMIWNAVVKHPGDEGQGEPRRATLDGQPHSVSPGVPSPLARPPNGPGAQPRHATTPERWIPPPLANAPGQDGPMRGRQRSVSGFGPSHIPDESHQRRADSTHSPATPNTTYTPDPFAGRRMTEEPEEMTETETEDDDGDGDDDSDDDEEEEEKSFGHVGFVPPLHPPPEQRRSIPIPTSTIPGPHKLWRPSLESLKPSRTMSHVGAPGTSPTGRAEHFGGRERDVPGLVMKPRTSSNSFESPERASTSISNAEREAADVRRAEEAWQSLTRGREKPISLSGTPQTPSAAHDVRPRTAEGERIAREEADRDRSRGPSTSPAHVRREQTQIWHPSPTSSPLERQRTPESPLPRAFTNPASVSASASPLERQRTGTLESLLSKSLAAAAAAGGVGGGIGVGHQKVDGFGIGQVPIPFDRLQQREPSPFGSPGSSTIQDSRSSIPAHSTQPAPPLSGRPTLETFSARPSAPANNTAHDIRSSVPAVPMAPLSRHPAPEVFPASYSTPAMSANEGVRAGFPAQSTQAATPLSRHPTPEVLASRPVASSNPQPWRSDGAGQYQQQYQQYPQTQQQPQPRPSETTIPLEPQSTPYMTGVPIHPASSSTSATENMGLGLGGADTQTREAEEERARLREENIRRREEELARRDEDIKKREEAVARREAEERVRQREEELKQQEEELARRAAAVERREAEERKREEDRARAELLKKQEEKKREENRVRLDQLKRQEDKKREEDRARAEALKKQEEARKKAEEERTKAEARRTQEELRIKQEQLYVRQQEQLWQQHEARKQHEEAKRKEEEFRKREEEIKKKKTESTAGAGLFPGSSRSTSSASSSFSSASTSVPRSGSTSGSSASSSSRAGSTRSSGSTASDSTRPTSTASSTWSSGFPSASSAFPSATPSRSTPTASSSSSSSSRTATGDSGAKTSTGGWRSTSSTGGPTSTGASSFSSTPPSESDWQKRQEEQARKQQEQFRREAQRQEAEKQAKAAGATSKDQVVRAWGNYELAWAAMKDYPTLRWRVIPWPVLSCPINTEELTTNAIGTFVLSPHHSQEKTKRDRLKEQLLRWHPDRFEGKWLSKVDVEDKEAVRRGVGQVVRGLNELMARESSPFA